MKKLLALLLVLLTAIALTGCQKKTIVASINYTDGENSGGMNGEMNENSTLKDLFDELGNGTDFVYEVDGEGNIVTINNKANDELGSWTITINGVEVSGPIDKVIINDKDVCDVTYTPVIADATLGGWKVEPVSREELDENEKTVFTTALEGLVGETYEPVQVIAKQVVSGTNYAFLALGTTVTAEPKSEYCILKIYEDLEGNVKLENIASIDLNDIKTIEATDEQLLGGWTVTDTGKPGSLGSQEAQETFDKAIEGLTGVGYNPIQLLGSQLVGGTNYVALVRGRTVAVDEAPGLYVATWYVDLNGESTLTGITKFDLNHYLG